MDELQMSSQVDAHSAARLGSIPLHVLQHSSHWLLDDDWHSSHHVCRQVWWIPGPFWPVLSSFDEPDLATQPPMSAGSEKQNGDSNETHDGPP